MSLDGNYMVNPVFYGTNIGLLSQAINHLQVTDIYASKGSAYYNAITSIDHQNTIDVTVNQDLNGTLYPAGSISVPLGSDTIPPQAIISSDGLKVDLLTSNGDELVVTPYTRTSTCTGDFVPGCPLDLCYPYNGTGAVFLTGDSSLETIAVSYQTTGENIVYISGSNAGISSLDYVNIGTVNNCALGPNGYGFRTDGQTIQVRHQENGSWLPVMDAGDQLQPGSVLVAQDATTAVNSNYISEFDGGVNIAGRLNVTSFITVNGAIIDPNTLIGPVGPPGAVGATGPAGDSIFTVNSTNTASTTYALTLDNLSAGTPGAHTASYGPTGAVIFLPLDPLNSSASIGSPSSAPVYKVRYDILNIDTSSGGNLFLSISNPGISTGFYGTVVENQVSFVSSSPSPNSYYGIGGATNVNIGPILDSANFKGYIELSWYTGSPNTAIFIDGKLLSVNNPTGSNTAFNFSLEYTGSNSNVNGIYLGNSGNNLANGNFLITTYRS
jgi:hypothetical protein